MRLAMCWQVHRSSRRCRDPRRKRPLKPRKRPRPQPNPMPNLRRPMQKGKMRRPGREPGRAQTRTRTRSCSRWLYPCDTLLGCFRATSMPACAVQRLLLWEQLVGTCLPLRQSAFSWPPFRTPARRSGSQLLPPSPSWAVSTPSRSPRRWQWLWKGEKMTWPPSWLLWRPCAPKVHAHCSMLRQWARLCWTWTKTCESLQL
mmetsp:Transcript_44367/g.92695  ORF Transcript_44367/g.92695 Transcript_44367/m.92695 type:complete len:201 (-) Transcript_44367:961-1563(-)